MSKSQQSQKSSDYAAYMKRMGIKRTTGQCPWGCGASIANGGPALMNHLNRCKGKARTKK